MTPAHFGWRAVAAIIFLWGSIAFQTDAQSKTPVISSASVDYDTATLIISGSNFEMGPAVTLGSLTLEVQLVTASQILASFPVATPPTSLPPGTYLLNVTFNKKGSATFTVALGTVGPSGSTGATGPSGPQGPRGPSNLFSNIGTPMAVPSGSCCVDGHFDYGETTQLASLSLPIGNYFVVSKIQVTVTTFTADVLCTLQNGNTTLDSALVQNLGPLASLRATTLSLQGPAILSSIGTVSASCRQNGQSGTVVSATGQLQAIQVEAVTTEQ